MSYRDQTGNVLVARRTLFCIRNCSLDDAVFGAYFAHVFLQRVLSGDRGERLPPALVRVRSGSRGCAVAQLRGRPRGPPGPAGRASGRTGARPFGCEWDGGSCALCTRALRTTNNKILKASKQTKTNKRGRPAFEGERGVTALALGTVTLRPGRTPEP